jgi:hypothetical protein
MWVNDFPVKAELRAAFAKCYFFANSA